MMAAAQRSQRDMAPFFSSLPLRNFGLEWIHSPAPLAHPLDDGTAVMLERNIDDAAEHLGRDGTSWRKMMEPFADNWVDFARQILSPPLTLPRRPVLLARFGLNAFVPAQTLANHHFREERTRALFAGLAAHSFLSLNEPLSAAVETAHSTDR